MNFNYNDKNVLSNLFLLGEKNLIFVQVEHIGTTAQIADIFAKSLFPKGKLIIGASATSSV